MQLGDRRYEVQPKADAWSVADLVGAIESPQHGFDLLLIDPESRVGHAHDRLPVLSRELDIDLSFLPDGNYSMEAYQDGVNADRFGSDYRQVKSSVNKSTKLKLKLAPGGGWAARIHP